MTIEEKIKKMNEMLAEVNNLAKEIDEEVNKKQTDDVDMLSIYINDIEHISILYWVDADGEVDDGTAEYKPDHYNPYSNYVSDTYAKTAAKMKKFTDMLLAFKWCYDRNYEPDWSAKNTKHCVIYDSFSGQYSTDCRVNWSCSMVYFSSEAIAQKCADWLNEIDPEGVLVLGTKAMDK